MSTNYRAVNVERYDKTARHLNTPRASKSRTNREQKSKWWSEYTLYLKSAEWDIARSLALARDGECCTKCGGTRSLQAHHVNYPDNIWETKVEDLTTLCFVCHRDAHWANGKLHAVTWEEHLALITSLPLPLPDDAVQKLRDAKRFGIMKIKSQAGRLLNLHNRFISARPGSSQKLPPDLQEFDRTSAILNIPWQHGATSSAAAVRPLVADQARQDLPNNTLHCSLTGCRRPRANKPAPRKPIA